MLQPTAEPVGLARVIAPGRSLFLEIGRLRDLHLDSVDTGFGAPVVAGRPAAPEAAVEDMGVAPGAGADSGDGGLDRGRAGLAAVGADVEIGQHAVEEEGNARPDRVAVVDD